MRAALANSPPEAAVAVLRRAAELHLPTPALVSACRREVERLRFIKDMMPAVTRHFDGVEYVCLTQKVVVVVVVVQLHALVWCG